MPELPEVETARRQLERWMVGAVVKEAIVPPSRLLGGPPDKIKGALEGHRVVAIERKGKHLLVGLDGDRGLYLHLGMTGRFSSKEGPVAPQKATRLVLVLGDRVVYFDDPRMFGRIDAGERSMLRKKWLDKLGPDALLDPPTGPSLAERLGRSSRAIKVALLDQAKISGIGNIQAVEALWRAKIGPMRLAKSLSPKEWSALAKGIRDSIRFTLGSLDVEEVRYLSDGAENPFFVYERRGQPCRRCKTPIASQTVAGRSTYWCPTCQLNGRRASSGSGRAGRGPKTPSDRRRPSPRRTPR